MNESVNTSPLTGVLGEKAILERLFVTGDLVIHPIIDLSRQIGPASLDVRLGTRFQSQRTTSLIEIDPLSSNEEIERDMLKVVDEFTIDPTEAYILHPGDFALACTFEYVVVGLVRACRFTPLQDLSIRDLKV